MMGWATYQLRHLLSAGLPVARRQQEPLGFLAIFVRLHLALLDVRQRLRRRLRAPPNHGQKGTILPGMLDSACVAENVAAAAAALSSAAWQSIDRNELLGGLRDPFIIGL